MQTLEGGGDVVDVGDIVDAKADGALEEAVVGFNDDFLHIDAELRGDDVGDTAEDSQPVNAADGDGGREKDHLVGVPRGSEDA